MINKPKKPSDKLLHLLLQGVYEIGGIRTILVGRVENCALKYSTVMNFGP